MALIRLFWWVVRRRIARAVLFWVVVRVVRVLGWRQALGLVVRALRRGIGLAARPALGRR